MILAIPNRKEKYEHEGRCKTVHSNHICRDSITMCPSARAQISFSHLFPPNSTHPDYSIFINCLPSFYLVNFSIDYSTISTGLEPLSSLLSQSTVYLLPAIWLASLALPLFLAQICLIIHAAVSNCRFTTSTCVPAPLFVTVLIPWSSIIQATWMFRFAMTRCFSWR